MMVALSQLRSRLTGGGELLEVPKCEVVTSIVRVQVGVGLLGCSEMARPTASTSGFNRPVATSTELQNERPGKNSGTPLPLGSVTSMSPIRKSVWLQEVRNPPTREPCPDDNPPPR